VSLREDIMDEFGADLLVETDSVPGAYWAPGASSATVTANIIVNESPPLFQADGMDMDSNRTAGVKVAVSDFPVVVREGKFVVGSDTWVITDAPLQSGAMWTCVCEFSTRVSVGKNRGDT
jgi:hypothetical protein